MPKAEIEKEAGPSGPSVNLDIDKEESVEFPKYATSIRGINFHFRLALCGWVVKAEKAKTLVLNIDDEIQEIHYDIDKTNRICNESCADYLANQIYPLVCHTTQLSCLTARQIFDDWDTLADEINYALCHNLHKDNNSYDIKGGYLGDIFAYCLGYNAFTQKALDGFMVKKQTESTTAIFSHIDRPGGISDNRGFWDKLLPFGKGR